jgi:lauroyl/myristoyl acyltransferase
MGLEVQTLALPSRRFAQTVSLLRRARAEVRSPTQRGNGKIATRGRALVSRGSEADYCSGVRALWRKVRYRIEWLALLLLTKIVPLLSRHNCYRLAQILGATAAVLDRPGRRIALTNLEVALPNEVSPARRTEVVRESYQQFARTLLDLCWSPRLTKENLGEFIEVVGGDAALKEIAAARGIIFTTFHYGNFEWTAQMIGLHDFPALTLAQEFKNPLLEPIVAKLRKHSNVESTSPF